MMYSDMIRAFFFFSMLFLVFGFFSSLLRLGLFDYFLIVRFYLRLLLPIYFYHFVLLYS